MLLVLISIPSLGRVREGLRPLSLLLVLISIPSLGRVREGLKPLPLLLVPIGIPSLGRVREGLPMAYRPYKSHWFYSFSQSPDNQLLASRLAKGRLLHCKRCPFGVRFMAFCLAFCRLLQICWTRGASHPICKYSERRVQSKTKDEVFIQKNPVCHCGIRDFYFVYR